MQILYLIRHGETTHNADGRVQGHTESHLSDLGREQARRLAGRLADAPIRRVVSSPLSRAVETARIAFAHRAPVETHPGLREIHLGEWEGRRADELREHYPEQVRLWFQRPSAVRIPGAETVRGFRRRVANTFADIRRTSPAEGAVAVVAHGGVICVYLTHLLGMRLDDLWRFKIRNASVTRVVFPQDRPRIDLLGDIHHLEGVLRDAPPGSFRLFP